MRHYYFYFFSEHSAVVVVVVGDAATLCRVRLCLNTDTHSDMLSARYVVRFNAFSKLEILLQISYLLSNNEVFRINSFDSTINLL